MAATEGSGSQNNGSEGQRRDGEGEEHSQARQRAARMLAAGALTGHPRLRLYTRSCRLEMYVAQELWESLDRSNGCHHTFVLYIHEWEPDSCLHASRYTLQEPLVQVITSVKSEVH